MRVTLLSIIILLAAALFLLWSFLSTPDELMVVPTLAPTVEVIPTPTAIVVVEGGQSCSAEITIAGGYLVEGVVGAPAQPNPIFADPNPVDRMLVDLLFDGLVRMDERGLPQPALAAGWQVSEDGRTLRFTLRDDVQWHDGQPLTTDDVAFSYGMLASADLPNGVSDLWQTVQINPIDRLTVDFVLSEPYAPFLEAVSRGILPAHLLAGTSAATLASSGFNSLPIGTGPFVAANDWTANGVLRLTPNASYWGDVDLDGLEVRFFPSDAALADAYQSGAVDAVGLISAESFTTLATLPNIRFFSSPERHTTHLIFNNASGHTVDQRIREAIAHTIDRGALIHEAVSGQGTAFNGPYAPHSWAANPSFPLFPTSGVTATALLEESRWVVSEESGVRQRLVDAGTATERLETLSFALLALDSPRQVALATAVQTQLAEQSIAVDLRIQSMDGYRAALSERNFDLAILEVLPLQDPDLYDFWSQEAIVQGQNYAGWNNRRASEALEIARQLYEPEERFEYYAGFNGVFADELPALGLYQTVESYGIRDSIVSAGTGQSVVIGRISTPRDRYQTINDWRLETTQISVPCEP